MDKWLAIILGLGVCAGLLLAEVACMLLEGRRYAAALACFFAALILIETKRMTD